MTTAGQSFLNLTFCKTTYKEFIKPYLSNASPSPCYSTDVTTLLPEHTSLEQENYTLLCSQSLFFFLCFAQFWCTEERMHELSKIFAGHVLLVAKIKVSAQA